MSGDSPRGPRAPLAGVLLDLDGTLLDTAPDLTRALNALLIEERLAPLPLAQVRPHVSHGASAVVRLGFPETAVERFDTLRARFLELYARALAIDTVLFPGFREVLDELDAHRLPWGVVTNKPARFTEPLLQTLGLRTRARCVISADSLPRRKPDPLPLLVAAQNLGLAPSQCLYLGDALRDAQAAQAAGMVALGARYGYLQAADEPDSWPVHGWINTPAGLLDWVGLERPGAARQAHEPLAAVS